MISIADMYVQSNKIMTCGVQGYHVKSKYVNSYDHAQAEKQKLKRGSYLDDYAKVHGYIPGPGVYNHAKNLWPSKCKLRKEKPPHKKTFIEQIVEKSKKQKQPAPGQYNLQKSMKQKDEERKRMARNKRTQADRITYLDGVQYEATQTPGVGKYNTRVRPSSSVSHQRHDNPEKWRKKHLDQEKKSKKKRTQPDAGSYDPTCAKSYEKKVQKKGEWNRENRFGADKGGSGLGPGKYIEVEDWKKKRPMSAPRVAYKSIYYH